MVASVQYEADLNDSSGTSRQVTFTRPVRSGHAVLAFVFWKTDVTISKVEDSASNTYVDSGAGRLARPTDGYLQCYGAKNVTGGTLAVTVEFSGSATSIYIILVEVLGAHTTTLFGATGTGTATSGTTMTTGTFTPSYSSGCLLAFAAANVSTTTEARDFAGILSMRTALPANAGMGVAELAYASSLGSNITCALDAGAELTKGAILAVELQAATQVYASRVVVGISTDGRFTVGGQPTFLVGPTYFDALDWWHSDLTAMRDAGYNTMRVLLDKEWEDSASGGESIFNSNGTIRPERIAKIHALILMADYFGMAVEVVIHVADGEPDNTAAWITNATNRANAVTNAVAALKQHTNVYWDVCNEFNYGAAYDTWTELQPLVDAALAEDPDGVFCVSGAGSLDGTSWDWALEYDTDALISADIDDYENSGLPVFGYHEGRQTDWWQRIGTRAKIIRQYLDSIGRRNMPIYFNEPSRRGAGAASTGLEQIQAVRNAARSYLAGDLAGLILHSGASFQMATATMVSQFDAQDSIGFNGAGLAAREILVRSLSFVNFSKPVLRG